MVATGAEVGAAAEAMWEIVRSDAQSERRSSEDEKVAEEFIDGISYQGSVARVEEKAARFMRAGPGAAWTPVCRGAAKVAADVDCDSARGEVPRRACVSE